MYATGYAIPRRGYITRRTEPRNHRFPFGVGPKATTSPLIILGHPCTPQCCLGQRRAGRDQVGCKYTARSLNAHALGWHTPRSRERTGPVRRSSQGKCSGHRGPGLRISRAIARIVAVTHVDLGTGDRRWDWVAVLGGCEGTRGGDLAVHSGLRLVGVPRRVLASGEIDRTCRRISGRVTPTAQPEEQYEDGDHGHNASYDAAHDRCDVGRLLGAVAGVAVAAASTSGL